MGMHLVENIRGIKGAAANILLFFIIRFANGQTENVNQKYIQQMTGYSDKTTEDGLLTLFNEGLVIRNDRFNWGLAGNIDQLPLMATLLGGGAKENKETHGGETDELKSIGVVEVQEDHIDEITGTRKNSVSGENVGDTENFRVVEENDPDLTGTRKNSVSGENVGDTEKFRVVEENEPDFTGTRKNSVSHENVGDTEKFRIVEENEPNLAGTRKNSVSDTENFRVDCPSTSSRYINNLDKDIRLLLLKLGDTEKFRVVENMQTCDECGIYEPARTKLSLLKTTTPQLIRFHCENLTETDTLGLAIHRIEHNQRISQKWVREQQDKALFSSDEAVQDWTKLYPKSDIPQDDFKKVLDALSLDFNKATFETWLKPLEVIEVKADEWTVSAMNTYGAKWVVDHAVEKMEAAAGVRIKIVCNGTVID